MPWSLVAAGAAAAAAELVAGLGGVSRSIVSVRREGAAWKAPRGLLGEGCLVGSREEAESSWGKGCCAACLPACCWSGSPVHLPCMANLRAPDPWRSGCARTRRRRRTPERSLLSQCRQLQPASASPSSPLAAEKGQAQQETLPACKQLLA